MKARARDALALVALGVAIWRSTGKPRPGVQFWMLNELMGKMLALFTEIENRDKFRYTPADGSAKVL